MVGPGATLIVLALRQSESVEAFKGLTGEMGASELRLLAPARLQ